ncbi:MAG: leucine-rich repeat domain-containing protein [Acutalibacteraceae bacterium]
MIVISDRRMIIPDSERYIGSLGDNMSCEKEFLINGDYNSEDYIYRLYLTFKSGAVNYFTLDGESTAAGIKLLWKIQRKHIIEDGIVKAQIKAFENSDEIWHSTIGVFMVLESLEFSDDFAVPTEFEQIEKKLNEKIDVLRGVRAQFPKIGSNGNWFVYDADKQEYADTGNPSRGEKGDTGSLQAGDVKTENISDKAVTEEKLENGAVTEEKLSYQIKQKLERVMLKTQVIDAIQHESQLNQYTEEGIYEIANNYGLGIVLLVFKPSSTRIQQVLIPCNIYDSSKNKIKSRYGIVPELTASDSAINWGNWTEYASNSDVLDNTEAITQNTADIELIKAQLSESINAELPNGLSKIADFAFSYNKNITGASIPGTVTSIGECAFIGCTGLTGITIPDSVTSIGTGAFEKCTGLTSVTVPGSVTSIGNGAFWYCSGITNLVISNGVQSIGRSAFNRCTSLTGVSIPSSITSIGEYAFYSCSNITNVTIASGFNANGLDLSGSTKYTAQTVAGWLEALADRTGQSAYKLTIGAANKAKLTAEQLAVATNKNWVIS